MTDHKDELLALPTISAEEFTLYQAEEEDNFNNLLIPKLVMNLGFFLEKLFNEDTLKKEIYHLDGQVKAGYKYLVHHCQNIKIGYVMDKSKPDNINWLIFHCGLCDMYQKINVEIEKKTTEIYPKKDLQMIYWLS